MIQKITAIGVALMLCAAGACHDSGALASESDLEIDNNATGISSPGAFRDDLDASIAVSGDSLWLAKTGLDSKGRVRTQTLRFRNGRWKPLPGRPRSTTDTRLFVTAFKEGTRPAGPCVADTAPTGNARVRCFDGRRWRGKQIPRKWRTAYVEGLADYRGRLVLLMQRNRRNGANTSSWNSPAFSDV